MKRITILLSLFFCALNLSGIVNFSGLDLKEPGILLFRAEADSPLFGSYGTLLRADLSEKRMHQLTFFPENLTYLRETGQLQIQNRFGVFRTDKTLSSMAPVASFPSFVRGAEIREGKIINSSGSPDGNYLIYVKPVSPAYGNLILFDVRQELEVVIAERIALSFTVPGALWSADSQFFVYSKEGSLYYFSMVQYREKRVLAEDFRLIGKGRLENVRWSGDGRLYFLSGSLVYQILSAEFFTRSLYSELLRVGRIIGKIPFDFDPNFDRFWVSPDGKKILLDKGGRNIFLYYLSEDDYSSTATETPLPYLFLPRNTRVRDVLWTRNDSITLLTGGIIQGSDSTSLVRLNLSEKQAPLYFRKTSDAGVRGIVLSNDESRIALFTRTGVTIKKSGTWETEKVFTHPEPITGVWTSHETLIIAGRHYIEEVSLIGGAAKLITLSQPGVYGFTTEREEIGVRTASGNYLFDGQGWKKTENLSFRLPNLASSKFRVYLERTSSYSYKNMVMVRQVEGLGTNSLFPYPHKRYEPFPPKEEPYDLLHFAHGSRIRARDVSLVFNAIDSVEGLTYILSTLAEYGLRCTFFINGEFMRRNPEAVKEIAESGHEVGSLFYVYFDMTDARFRVNKDFVKKGLARNEDDYFAITGRELSLIWHAPYYVINTDILEASGEMNYVYIGRDVDPLDWVTLSDRLGSTGLYFKSADMVERILNLKKPGSIIPIRVGQPQGTREDYLFLNLDILINSLIESGYNIIPVTELLEKAR